MRTTIRLKLEMATRARDFGHDHPDTNPGYVAAVARLEERLARAEALAQQEVAGRQAVVGAVANKDQLRRQVYTTLRLLAGVAVPAALEEPGLNAGIPRPRLHGSNQEFLTLARVAETAATAHRDVLVRHGMPDTFLESLGAMLDRFEAVLNDKHAGRSAHVGARAELDAVTAEIMAVVKLLDALNQFRFRNDAESLGAWRSARNVAWPVPAQGAAATPAA